MRGQHAAIREFECRDRSQWGWNMLPRTDHTWCVMASGAMLLHGKRALQVVQGFQPGHIEQILLVSVSEDHHLSSTGCIASAGRSTGIPELRVKPMKFRPLHDRVMIRRVEPEGATAGGIIIPDTAREKPGEGEIVEVGPGARDEKGTLVPLDVKKGDRILFGKWSGTEIKLGGEDLLIMNESDIMGVIDGPVAAKAKAAQHRLSPSMETKKE
jgi:chaperonin GroES